MKTSHLLMALVSSASLSIGVLPATNSFAQLTPAQQRAEAQARARAPRPAPQPRPQQQRPVQQGGGGSARVPRQNGGGGHTDRNSFVQNHGREDAWRHGFYAEHQAVLHAWIEAGDHLFVHAANSDGSAVGDADGYNWDDVSTDAVQACIDNADAAGVDDSSCQVSVTQIG